MHRTVAAWYEDTYGAGGDADPPLDGLASLEAYYPLLVHHYERAEDLGRERVYGLLAGERAAAQYANADAVRFLSRALAITDEADAALRYRLLAAREGVHDRTGDRGAQAADIEAMGELAEGDGEASWRPDVMLRLANLAAVTGEYAQAATVAAEGVAAARARHDVGQETRGLIAIGKIEWQRGQFERSRDRLVAALGLTHATGDVASEAEVLLNLGAIDAYAGNAVASVDARHRALAHYRALGDKSGEAGCLTALAATVGQEGQFTSAHRYSEQALAVCRLIGHRRGLSIIEGNMAADRFDLGDHAGARVHLQSALVTCRELGDKWGEATNLDTLGIVMHRLGDLAAARQHLDAAVAIQHAIGDQHGAGYTLTHLGDLYADTGDWLAAEDAHAQALAVRRELGQESLAMDNLAGLAWIALSRGDVATARAHGDGVLAWVDANGLDGMEFPVLVAWRCHQVLVASAEWPASPRPADAERARQALERGHALVLDRAGGIADAELRRSFLTNVPFNRAVIEAWEAGAAD